jgi:ectoine hydroxylase-related dioxygenase (phytanoyl-CoA dioxygenase family)
MRQHNATELEKKSTLSTSQLNEFKQNGFLFMPHFFDEAEIKKVSQAIEALAQQPPAECVGKQMVYFEDSVIESKGRVLSRIEKFIEYDEVLRAVTEDSRLIHILSQLLGEEAILFKEKVNFKLSGGRGFEPHQDIQPGWDDYATYFMSVLVTIDPSTLENGCLELASGHHKRGLIGERWKPLSEQQLQGIEFVNYPSEPGDVIFFDCFVPHQSAPNLTDKPRRNLYLTYNGTSQGDHRLQYYADKRNAFPPDFERESGKEYHFKV